MKKLLAGLLSLCMALGPFGPAYAANVDIPGLPAAGSVAGTGLFECSQGGVSQKCTAAQEAAYIYSLMSGDATAAAGGAVTLKNTGPGATGPLGSATVAPIITIDAQGRVTALSSATITPALGSITGFGTGVGAALAINIGSAGAPVLLNGALGTPSSGTLTNTTGFPTANLAGLGAGVAAALANAANGAGGFIIVGNAMTSVTPGGGLVSGITASCTQTAITGAGTLSAAMCINAQTGTTYAILDTDRSKLVTLSNGSPVAVSIAQAGTASAFANGWFVDVVNKGAGTATITPTTSTINGTTTLVLTTGQGARIYSDGSNYQVNSGSGTGGSGISSLTPGGGLVSGITASCTQTAITTSGTLSQSRCINAQTGTTYAILDTDRGKLVTGSNAATQAYSIAQAGAASAFANGWNTTILNKGVGTLTITPTTSTINGAATYLLFAGQSVTISSDGSNYQIDPGTSGGVAVNLQTGANYAIVATDFGKLVNLSNASNQIPTIAVASAFGAAWYTNVCNIGAGTQTITPTTSTIGGAATLVLPAGSSAAPKCVTIVSDGTNYQIAPSYLANVVQTNVANTFTATQTFAGVLGTVSTQSGTTYTLANTDCGTTVRFSSASAVTVTIPATLTVGCNIAVLQAAAGQVTMTGTAVSAATLQSAHTYTKTFGAGAMLGVTMDASSHAILTGDGA